MAEAFIGLSVLATLKEPPQARVRGLVINVAEQQLTLNKVTWLESKFPQEILIVHASNILELEVEAETPRPRIRADESKRDFVDPAIVSYERHDGQDTGRAIDSPRNGVVTSGSLHSQPGTENSLHGLPTKPAQLVLQTTTTKAGRQGYVSPKHDENIRPSATLSGPFSDLSLNGQAHEDGLNTEDLNQPNQQTRQSPREQVVSSGQEMTNMKKRKVFGRKDSVSTQTQPVPSLGPSTTPLSQKRRQKQQKGWRQTPLLSEPSMTDYVSPHPEPDIISPNLGLKPPPPNLNTGSGFDNVKGRRRRYKEEEDENGWATGDATDIQDMGDFDFEGNLSKFDKRKVFDQIKQDDTTADEARLVSFNRLPAAKPGTAGGKNLHHTENVLDPPLHKSVEHSSDSDLAISETRMSRTSTRKIPSRKGSALIDDHHGSGSTLITVPVAMARQISNHSRAASPKIKVDPSTENRKASDDELKPSFRVTSTTCQYPSLSPLQILELEQLAISELGLTEEMMTETAARSIAETAYQLFTAQPIEKHRKRTKPTIVILAGDHKTGARAIAAARHLRNHGAHALLLVLGWERENDFLEGVRRQLKLLRNAGGQSYSQDELTTALTKKRGKKWPKPPRPVDVIIDALLGMHISFDDLRADDQAAYIQLAHWANDADAPILSIDIPSGIDASSGHLTIHDSKPLYLHAVHVLSLSAPKTGLLTSLARVKKVDSLGLYVADIGISPLVWKKFATSRRIGVNLHGEWVAAIQYDTREKEPKKVKKAIKWG